MQAFTLLLMYNLIPGVRYCLPPCSRQWAKFQTNLSLQSANNFQIWYRSIVISIEEMADSMKRQDTATWHANLSTEESLSQVKG